MKLITFKEKKAMKKPLENQCIDDTQIICALHFFKGYITFTKRTLGKLKYVQFEVVNHILDLMSFCNTSN